MALSDPTYGVPTPTGVLQGVAAFNYDGGAWQPAGLAGPCVATPTGVLRGVAAFNDGAPWQPAGLAGPSVATPTGVLEGVAVYTWSGSAWVPPGGQPSPSTPSGALRGVAAFDWDGSQWQPAGQAGPDVATPYGVLQGVARFNWTGSAWAAVGAPSLSLDFMTPGTLDPRITFTRASTATYTDATGTIQTAAINVPRWDYDPVTHQLKGLLMQDVNGPQAQDRCDISPANTGGWFVSPGGSWFAEFISIVASPVNARIIGEQAGSGVSPIFLAPGSLASQYDSSIAVSVTGPPATANAVHKAVSTYVSGTGRVCVDGGAIASGALSVGYGRLASSGLGFMMPEGAGSPDNLPGYIRRVTYWPRVLSDAEMQAVTT